MNSERRTEVDVRSLERKGEGKKGYEEGLWVHGPDDFPLTVLQS